MTIRLALAIGWCGLGALVVALCASESFAGRARPEFYACPPIETPTDADGCPVHGPGGYAEGAMAEDQTAWPSRERVCARLAELCRAD